MVETVLHQESSRSRGKVALVTGANTGIGKDVARQLAISNAYAKVILACRNPAKAELAKKDLETLTGKPVFEIILMDLSDAASVRVALSSLSEPIDHLVMNAGGSGGKTPLALTKDGGDADFCIERARARGPARRTDPVRPAQGGGGLCRQRGGPGASPSWG